MVNKNILEENFFVLLAVLNLHTGFGSINGQKIQNDNLFMNSQEIVFKLCFFFFQSSISALHEDDSLNSEQGSGYLQGKYEKLKLLSRVLFAFPWTIQSMEFSRPEYWSGEPFPSPGDLPNPEIKPRSPALQADSFPAEPQGKGFSKEGFSKAGVGKVEPVTWFGMAHKLKMAFMFLNVWQIKIFCDK